MSGYLTSLVQRAIAPEPSIGPRLSPMFGPPMRGPAWESSAPPDEEDVGREPVGHRAGARTSPAAVPGQPVRSVGAPVASTADGAPDAERPVSKPGRAATVRAARIATDPADDTDHAAPPRGDVASGTVEASPRSKASLRQDRPELTGEDDPSTPQQSNRVLPQRGDRISDTARVVPRRSEPPNAPDDGGASSTTIEARSLTPPHPGRRVETEPKVSAPPRQAQVGAESLSARPIPPAEPTPDLSHRSHKSVDADTHQFADNRAPVVTTKLLPVENDRPPVSAARMSLTAPALRDREAVDRRGPQTTEQTIQVTIGRIEVRAATAAEPRRKPPASTGATTLEAYLRQRSGRSAP
jgi:hypothetical protein